LILLSCFVLSDSHAGQYFQNFQSSAASATNFDDGSQLFSTHLGTVAFVAGASYKELQLTATNFTAVHTAYLLPDLDPGTPVCAFSAKWNMEINGNFPNAADGFSFNFGDLSTKELVGTSDAQDLGYGTGISLGVKPLQAHLRVIICGSMEQESPAQPIFHGARIIRNAFSLNSIGTLPTASA
jgi:hypothetical protein